MKTLVVRLARYALAILATVPLSLIVCIVAGRMTPDLVLVSAAVNFPIAYAVLVLTSKWGK